MTHYAKAAMMLWICYFMVRLRAVEFACQRLQGGERPRQLDRSHVLAGHPASRLRFITAKGDKV